VRTFDAFDAFDAFEICLDGIFLSSFTTGEGGISLFLVLSI
jgi:hypothetical protein